MKVKRLRFTVEGSGVFPYDMLRYDACWPETEASDSYKLNDPYAPSANYGDRGTRRQVTLLTDCHHAPTVGRWESFGWKVVKTEKYPY